MRLLPVFLTLLFVSTLAFTAEPPECATCEELAGAPQAGLFVLVRDTDPANQYVDIVGYYEDLSASPIRQPLNNTILIVELINNTNQKALKKIYTDQNGTASFRFNEWNDSCITFKVMYCPYCIPTDVECEGFKQCLDFGKIQTTADKSDDIDDATGETAPDPLSDAKFIPQLATASWCPPPTGIATTPALCFPLILLFSLLSGALYLTGRNPFAGFNIGGMRIGSHIRYQARGRGFSFSVMQMAVAAGSLVQAGVGIGKQGMGGFAKKEAAAVNARGIMGIKGAIGQVKAGIKKHGEIRAGQAAERTVVAGRTGTGTSGGTGTVGGLGMTAGGMQAMAGGGSSGAFGGQIFQGGFFGALARIAVFIVLQIPIFRSIDAIYNEATYDSRTERGRSLFEAIFSIRDRTVPECVETMRSIRGENGGYRVYLDENHTREAEVLQRIEGTGTGEGGNGIPRGSAAYVMRAPPGMTTENGTIRVEIQESTGRINSVGFNLSGVGDVVIRRPLDGGSTEFMVWRTPEGSTERRLERLESGSEQMRAVLDAYTALPIELDPGHRGSTFVDNYNATCTTMAYLAMQAQQAAQMDLLRNGPTVTDRAAANPAATAEIDRVRREEAEAAVAGAFGRTSVDGVDAGNLTGLPATRESRVGELGVHEVAAERFNAADTGPHGSVTVLMTTPSGAATLADRAGLSGGDADLARAHLPGVLGSLTPQELSRLDPSTLSLRLEGLRGPDNQPVFTSDQASRIAGEIAPVVNREMSGLERRLGSEGFPPAFFANAGDMSSLSALSRVGAVMSDERLPEFVASRPELIARLPPAVAEPATEYAYLSRQAGALSGMSDINHPPPPGADSNAALDRIDELNRGRLTSAGFDTATQVVPPSRLGPEYVEERGRLDAGLHYYAVEDRFHPLPPPAEGMPEIPPALPIVSRTSQGLDTLRSSLDAEGPPDIGTARAIVVEEYRASRDMERAARAAGDSDAAALFARRAEGCNAAMERIDTIARSGSGSNEGATGAVEAITGPAPTSDYANAVVRTRDALRGIQTGEREVPGRERPPVGDFPTPPPVRREPGAPPRDEGESRMA